MMTTDLVECARKASKDYKEEGMNSLIWDYGILISELADKVDQLLRVEREDTTK